jgi:AcrR family transcriptional regulator
MSITEQDTAEPGRSSHLSSEPATRLTRRETQKRETRERLIEAGESEFRQRGYNETTAENIATAAGTSRATFYVYFKSKTEVVLELMRRISPEVLKAYSNLDAIAVHDLDHVRTWLRETIALWEERRAEFTAIEQALADDDAVANMWVATLGDSYVEMPRTFGRITEPAGRERARLHLMTLQAALDRMMFFATIRRQPLDMELLVEVLAAQWLSFLKSADPAGPSA